jgi:lipoprotein-anchoring transpeptidase ErfK/SrfK
MKRPAAQHRESQPFWNSSSRFWTPHAVVPLSKRRANIRLNLECISVRIVRLIAPLTAAAMVLPLGQAVHADLLIKVDKSTQRMIVEVNGRQLYDWPVSTGKQGFNTPAGAFSPFRMKRKHYSREWDYAPMPYSIFFTRNGHAIHGSYHRDIGRPASHGCVRLSVRNAATLWRLVRQEKMANTTVVLSNVIPDAGPTVADSAPPRRTADDSRHRAPRRKYRRRHVRKLLPFPFFLFGR